MIGSFWESITCAADPQLAGGVVRATASVRAAIPAGSAFLEGNGVAGPLVDVRKRPATEPVGPEPVALS